MYNLISSERLTVPSNFILTTTDGIQVYTHLSTIHQYEGCGPAIIFPSNHPKFPNRKLWYNLGRKITDPKKRYTRMLFETTHGLVIHIKDENGQLFSPNGIEHAEKFIPYQ